MAFSTLPPLPLPLGIIESYVSTDDLTYHMLEAGYDANNKKPLILLLHGFPELAFSWRKVMPSLAAGGYHVVAYDQRGYGRTSGWDTRPFSDVDLKTFAFTRLVTDAVRLVYTLGYKEVECVIGHDFGAVGSSLCALMRGDLFKSVVMMSHPFAGSGSLPFNNAPGTPQPKVNKNDVHEALAGLPVARKHYKWYYSTEPACQEMTEPKESMHEFLKGYFYLKGADWTKNDPKPLSAWSAPELSKLPNYYVMPLHSSMREAVAEEMTHEEPELVKKKMARWLSDSDLDVYVGEWSRNNFQGGLNWYRIATDPANQKDMELFGGKKIEVPSLFISGKQDWGTYQEPGVVERMGEVCSDLRGVELVDEAGHWVQQEQPDEVGFPFYRISVHKSKNKEWPRQKCYQPVQRTPPRDSTGIFPPDFYHVEPVQKLQPTISSSTSPRRTPEPERKQESPQTTGAKAATKTRNARDVKNSRISVPPRQKEKSEDPYRGAVPAAPSSAFLGDATSGDGDEQAEVMP